MVPTMIEIRKQPLAELVASIISMILGSIRAHGLRGLKDLPMMIMFAFQLRAMAREFDELMAAFKAGTLPPVPTAPEPAPLEWQAECAQLPATPRVAARSNPGNRHRQPRAVQPVAPAEDVGNDLPRVPRTARMPRRCRRMLAVVLPLGVFAPRLRYLLPSPRDRPARKIRFAPAGIRLSNSLRYRNKIYGSATGIPRTSPLPSPSPRACRSAEDAARTGQV
jgi:hypothetical protein